MKEKEEHSMDEYKIYRDIICIDLKSFYASVECAERGLDPFKTPLIVADESRGGGSVVLAVSPYLKKTHGLKNVMRLFEVPKINNLIIAKPRMRKYLEYSRDIIKIYLKYIAKEDLHIYSIDEAFLDLTPYLNYYEKTPLEISKMIMREIYYTLQIPSTCGIGDNLLLSKLALDLLSKKSKTHIAEMRYEDIKDSLWPLKPLSKMWGIGPRMEKRLNALGIYSVKDLACSDVKTLKKLFGVMGEELFYHAHGIDQSIISEKGQTLKIKNKSLGQGQTLFKDHDGKSILPVILEMVDEVGEKLRFTRNEARTIHLSIGYSKAFGGGFSRQFSLTHPTDSVEVLLQAVLTLFKTHYEDLPIRRITIRVTKLTPRNMFEQLSFFENQHKKNQSRQLHTAMDGIKAKYGKDSAMRLTSYLEGTKKERLGLIGGHNA